MTPRARVGRSRRAGGALLAAVVALSSLTRAPVSAHLGHVVLSAERYLKLDASEDDTRLVVSLTLGAEEGRRVLDAADVDRDGTVTPAESETYMRQWGDGLSDELPVEIDGERVTPLEFTDAFLDPVGAVAAVPVTVEMVAHLPIVRRESSIVFRDEMVGRTRFDRTDVAFRAHDGAELLACGTGETPTGRETSVSFGRAVSPTTPGIFAAHVRYPGRAEALSIPSWAWFAVAGVTLTTLLALARRRARR